MFLPTFKQVSSRVEHVRALLAEYDKTVTPANIKQEALPLVSEMLRELHFITADQEQFSVYRLYRPFHDISGPLQRIIDELAQQGFRDIECPECRSRCVGCGGEAGESRPRGPIDRPEMPSLPLELTGALVAKLMRELRPWLVEAFEELTESYPDLAPAPDRYIIGELGQLSILAHLFRQYQELSGVWSVVIATEGPEWTSVRVGARRLDLLSRVQAIYATMANPEVSQSRVFGGLFGS
jgi:hypothetical protein